MQSRRQRELAELVELLKQKHATDTAITEAAVKAGFEREQCSGMLAKRRVTVVAVRFEIAKKYLWPGYPAFIFGTTISALTLADAVHGGGHITIFHGMIIYGFCSIVAGHLSLRHHPL